MKDDLNVRQSHEVLGEVNNELVHESRGDVEPIQLVVQATITVITKIFIIRIKAVD